MRRWQWPPPQLEPRRVDLRAFVYLTGPGREGLKYYEAGLDLGLSHDPQESYRLFQGRVVNEYNHMVDEYKLTVIDANRSIEPQRETRATVSQSPMIA